MWQTILIQVILPAVVTVIGGWLAKSFSDLAKQQKDKNTREGAQMIAEIAAGKMQPLADELKAAASDGKLTKKEREQLKRNASHAAMEMATGPVGEFLVKLGFEAVGGLIEVVLGKRKK